MFNENSCKFNPKLALEDIKKASENLKGIINETRLIKSRFFSEESGNNVYLKTENLQFTGSFKIRGAYNKISLLSDEKKNMGIIASSAGNHAQGVAFSAKKLGLKSTIVMPNITPLIKVEATKNYGSDVVIHGDVYDESYNKAVELSERYGYEFIHPFDDYDIICGQGTVGLEILNELENVDTILVPVGGGGLISGIALAVKALKPNTRIIGVEPEGAMAMKLSLDNDELTSLHNVNTSAEGVAVRCPGKNTFDIIRNYVDDIITVSEKDIMESLLMLIEKHKFLSETAGVLPLAALKKLKEKDNNIACVISGGNIDVVTISSMINKGLISRGRIFGFSVDLPDKPGQLLKVSQLLSDLSANVIKLEHNQFKAMDRYLHVQLEVTVETNGHKHIQEILNKLKEENFTYKRLY